jgi:hypothetical protein
MYLAALAWLYVVLMMAAAEAMAPTGTVLGALFTLVLYGVLPLSIVLYLLGTPARRQARRRAEADEAASTQPDGSRLPSRDPVAPEREEP